MTGLLVMALAVNGGFFFGTIAFTAMKTEDFKI